MIEGYILRNTNYGFCGTHGIPWTIYCKDGRWVYECPQCREEGLMDSQEINMEELTSVATHCYICGGEIPTQYPYDTHTHICEECKQAVEWAKRKMKEEDDRR